MANNRDQMADRIAEMERVHQQNRIVDSLDPCGICYSRYGYRNDNDNIEIPIKLPCGHIFGNYCIDNWLHTANVIHSCPACRFPLFYKRCKHQISPYSIHDHPEILTQHEQLSEWCKDINCRVFERWVTGEVRVWLRAERDARWMLQAMEHSREDAVRLRAHLDFVVMRREESEYDADGLRAMRRAEYMEDRW